MPWTWSSQREKKDLNPSPLEENHEKAKTANRKFWCEALKREIN